MFTYYLNITNKYNKPFHKNKSTINFVILYSLLV